MNEREKAGALDKPKLCNQIFSSQQHQQVYNRLVLHNMQATFVVLASERMKSMQLLMISTRSLVQLEMEMSICLSLLSNFADYDNFRVC